MRARNGPHGRRPSDEVIARFVAGSLAHREAYRERTCGHAACAMQWERGDTRRANAEARRARIAESKAHTADLRAKRAAMVTAREEYRAAQRSYGRIRAHRKHHGLDEEAWAARLEAVGWACELCGKPLTVETGSVDHDHAKAARECPHDPRQGCPVCFRGVLCNNCNAILGALNDDPSRFDAAAAYLRERSGG